MKKFKQRVGFVVNFHNEYDFITKAYPAARQVIGAAIFRKIIAYNITKPMPVDLAGIQNKVTAYLTSNRKDIVRQLKKKKEQYETILTPFKKNSLNRHRVLPGFRGTTRNIMFI